MLFKNDPSIMSRKKYLQWTCFGARSGKLINRACNEHATNERDDGEGFGDDYTPRQDTRAGTEFANGYATQEYPKLHSDNTCRT